MNPQNKLENIRTDYKKGELLHSTLFENPIRQFEKWFEEAQNAQVLEPNAMTLATANADGIPDARIVLLKGLDEDGFRFYTNYNSTKGQELKENPQTCLVFFWPELERQVRITGMAYKLPEVTSENYFQSRPKASQIGAWASPQSQVIEDRTILEDNVQNLQEEYAEQEQLPKPPHWGGYIVKPYKIEFWQGRSSRLHDRLQYTLTELNPKKWTVERLAP